MALFLMAGQCESTTFGNREGKDIPSCGAGELKFMGSGEATEYSNISVVAELDVRELFDIAVASELSEISLQVSKSADIASISPYLAISSWNDGNRLIQV